MKFAHKTGLVVAACFLSIYGCNSGDDDSSPQGQAGAPGGGSGSGGKSGAAGKGGAGATSTGGTHGMAAGGEAGHAAGAENGGSPTETAGAGGASGDTGRAGSGSNEAGTTGEAGGAGAPSVACIHALTDRYVLRSNETLLYVAAPTDEHEVLDAATGLALTHVRGVADGSYHGCAVLSDKTVKCWQTNATYGNGEGQLGDGTTDTETPTFRATPVLTGPSTPLTNITALADIGPSTQSANNTCAIDGDGKLWCWGDLTYTVNNGSSLHTGYAQAITTDSLTPLTGVIQAAVTRDDVCVLVGGTPNEVWCWGYNSDGEASPGDTTKRQYPVKVPGLTAPSKVVISPGTTCVLENGNVRCWGYNSLSGATGTNSTAGTVSSPSLVVIADGTTPLSGVTELYPGYSSFAVLRDGAIWIWGAHFQTYATKYNVTNIALLGGPGGLGSGYSVRYLTTDDVYHDGMTNVPVSCGAN
jgi:hypothetical protein